MNPQTEKPSFEGLSVAFAVPIANWHLRRYCVSATRHAKCPRFKLPCQHRRPVRVNPANAVGHPLKDSRLSPPLGTGSGRKTRGCTLNPPVDLYRGGWADGRDRAWFPATEAPTARGNPERASDTEDFTCPIIMGCTHRPLLGKFNAAVCMKVLS